MKKITSYEMRSPYHRSCWFIWTLLLFFATIFILTACDKAADSTSTDRGDVHFSIRWNQGPDKDTPHRNKYIAKALSSRMKEGIAQIDCSVLSPSGKLLMKDSHLPHFKHRGALDNISSGRNRQIVCRGKDSNDHLTHLAQLSGITVFSGKAIDVGVLDFFPFIPKLNTPKKNAAVKANEFSLNWDSVIHARKYLVQVSPSSDFDILTVDEFTTETTYLPKILLPDTTYYWRVRALDLLDNQGQPSITGSFTTVSGSSCRAPALSPIGNQSVIEGESLMLDITAVDPDSEDTLTFSASTLPNGAAIDPVSGRFQWDTQPGDRGNYKVVFKVCDDCPEGPLCDTQAVTISVGDVCQPPVLSNIGPRRIEIEELLSLTLQAEAAGPDAGLSFQATNLPQGAHFIPSKGRFLWKPHFWETGNYQVNFKVCRKCSNGNICDSEQVAISVGDVCRPPKLQLIGAQQAQVGTPLELRLKADDPDQNGPLTYSAGDEFSPFIDPETGIFSWTPDAEDEGKHFKVRFKVCDACPETPQCDWEDVTITIGDGCRPPVLDPIGPQQGMEMGMEMIDFTISATDPDPGSVLTYNAHNIPTGAEFDPTSQHFFWAPGWGYAGEYVVNFEVCDNCSSGSLCDSEDVTMTMLPYCPKIEIDTSNIFHQVAVGETLEFQLRTNNMDVWNNIWIYEAYNLSDADIAQYFAPQTQIFSWQPAADDVGSHQINFRVCDNCPSGQQCADETFIIDVVEAHLSQPDIVEPADQVTLDNGCVAAGDPILWRFTWAPVAEADHYEISILHENTKVLTEIVSEPMFEFNCSEASQQIPQCHVLGEELEGWTWQVRAISEDSQEESYSLWSKSYNFNVSPLNCTEETD